MNIDASLIGSFREKVNSNSNFILNTYRNRNNKDQWSIICSCMDWISVSVRFLSSKTSFDDDIDSRVMELFSVISAVDIILESVNQLHRVLFNTNEVPFQADNTIFKNNQLNLPDNDYFKELRAMFGAHPVNLNHKNGKRWYASWPNQSFFSKDNIFEIRLYSNELNVPDLHFGININEIESFAIKHYEYLNTLINEIDNQFNLYCEKYKKIEIPIQSSHLQMLNSLKTESQARFNNDYYKMCIDELIIVFSTDLNIPELAEEECLYKQALVTVINEIKDNLQNMNLTDLTTDEILNPDYPYDKIGYSISKLYTYDFSPAEEPLFDFHLCQLNKFSNSIYNFTISDTKEQLVLKLKLMLYRFNVKGFS